MTQTLHGDNGVVKIQVDHETRLRSVERWKYSIPFGLLLGAAGFVGAILGKG